MGSYSEIGLADFHMHELSVSGGGNVRRFARWGSFFRTLGTVALPLPPFGLRSPALAANSYSPSLFAFVTLVQSNFA